MNPDRFYQQGIYNLIGSILGHYGLSGPPGLPEMDVLLEKNYQHIFLLVLDGLSVGLAESAPLFRQAKRCDIYSVYPPTTTAAMTTLQSGLSPIEHGWLGWNVPIPELDLEPVTLLTNCLMETRIPAARFSVAERYLSYPKIISRLAEKGIRAAMISPFERLRPSSFEELIQIALTQTQKLGPSFSFGYWTEPDYIQHMQGSMSQPAIELVAEFAAVLAEYLPQFKDTLVLLLSDHGMTRSTPIYLEDYPEIYRLLRQRISFEARNPNFFVKPGSTAEFSRRFRENFSDFSLYTHEEVFQSELYGPGEPHPSTRYSIGDFVAVAHGNRHLLMDRAHDPGFLGHHAGKTKEEMMIPLIIWECV